ncbi:MAG: shikimate kinase [Actinomycetota bacterium]
MPIDEGTMSGADTQPDDSSSRAPAPESGNREPRNIVLTGFMGTGKSTVGRLLAKRLGMHHLDTDQMIERRHGPIRRIFESLGEEGFRSIEREIAEELSADEGYVISTGGRFMLDERNAEILSRGNRVFCLVAELEVIYERVMRRRGARPMLNVDNPRARIIELMEERAAGYARFEAVPTDEAPASNVVDEIIRRLRV